MHIGRNIKSVLRELGVSQGELSRLTGIPERTISGWINGGEPNPGFQYIQKISEALGVTPGYIADHGSLSFRTREPQTISAKEAVAKALLADISRQYPYSPAAQALELLESFGDDGRLRKIFESVRKIWLSGNRKAIAALLTNLEAFVALVDAEEARTPSGKADIVKNTWT